MSSFYFLFAVLFAVSQLSQASFPYYYGGSSHPDYPALGYYGIADSYPYYPYAAYGYGAYPYGYPFSLHSHYHHPRAALRNVAKSFHREDGHLSETDMISPFAKKN
ncbi:hypothetical protein Y032_0042g602 [Ancylostoma ceylanicum]|uniref:Uncharacterized protein n=1 Tax=Ancylostoma ceylanicum TaxID=53326 RepID=A0A016UH34_9BILA|nr:hypothetical protein Y032_0042g602 [Ancylostoma ceylanicum]